MGSPRIAFVIGGAQKAGTTALAHYLASHRGLQLPKGKEAHVFDAPDFDDAWCAADIDARYAPHFGPGADALRGDATPIYMLHRRCVERIARYNPAMRWIILLRDPVDRAISQYHMERRRGFESWPMLAAFWLERLRLAGHRDDFGDGSPLRTKSYLLRGRYAAQLDVLYARFPAQQILLLASEDLRHDPAATLHRVCDFLRVAPLDERPIPQRVFEGRYPSPGPVVLGSLRLLLAPATRQLRKRYGISLSKRREPWPDRP